MQALNKLNIYNVLNNFAATIVFSPRSLVPDKTESGTDFGKLNFNLIRIACNKSTKCAKTSATPGRNYNCIYRENCINDENLSSTPLLLIALKSFLQLPRENDCQCHMFAHFRVKYLNILGFVSRAWQGMSEVGKVYS